MSRLMKFRVPEKTDFFNKWATFIFSRTVLRVSQVICIDTAWVQLTSWNNGANVTLKMRQIHEMLWYFLSKGRHEEWFLHLSSSVHLVLEGLPSKRKLDRYSSRLCLSFIQILTFDNFTLLLIAKDASSLLFEWLTRVPSAAQLTCSQLYVCLPATAPFASPLWRHPLGLWWNVCCFPFTTPKR
jgi:hypothetical protein